MRKNFTLSDPWFQVFVSCTSHTSISGTFCSISWESHCCGYKFYNFLSRSSGILHVYLELRFKTNWRVCKLKERTKWIESIQRLSTVCGLRRFFWIWRELREAPLCMPVVCLIILGNCRLMINSCHQENSSKTLFGSNLVPCSVFRNSHWICYKVVAIRTLR